MKMHSLFASGLAVVVAAVLPQAAAAAIIPTLHPGANFPTAAEFQTFDPTNPSTPATAERTLTGARNLTQTFQLTSAVNADEIDVMYVRGSTSSPSVRVRIFPVANATATDITNDFNDAVTNGFLLDETFAMPVGLSDNTARTLKLVLSNPVALPATTSPAGYALNFSVPDGTSEVFTWRFGDPGSGSTSGWYADGNVFYDDFIRSGSTENRRDGLFALNGDVTGPVIPEPATLSAFIIGIALATLRCRFVAPRVPPCS